MKQTSHDLPTLKNRTTLVGVKYWYGNLVFGVLPNSTNSIPLMQVFLTHISEMEKDGIFLLSVLLMITFSLSFIQP